jgi:hypothetical protein
MYQALVQVEVVHLGALVETSDRTACPFGQQWCNQLGFSSTPVAISAAYEHVLSNDLFQGHVVHAYHLLMPPGISFDAQALSGAVICIVEPPCDRAGWIGDMTAKGRYIHVIFDDMVSFAETRLDIALADY